MTASCTVTVNAQGAQCGADAVQVRESIFGQVAECAQHATPAPTPVAPESFIGRKVEVKWHTWSKPGQVVAERGAKVSVRFSPSKGAEPIVREFKVEDVRFT